MDTKIRLYNSFKQNVNIDLFLLKWFSNKI